MSDAQKNPKPPTPWSDTKALVKPRITRMVMITAAIGFKLGWDADLDWALAGIGTSRENFDPHALATHRFPWTPFFIAIIGTGIACMGASALNQWMEHDTDAMMDRTKDRPVAAGRFSRETALKVGVILSILGCAVVALSSRPWEYWFQDQPFYYGWFACLAAALTAFTVISYAWMYTPLKRRSTLALLVGTIPGATPPMIGFAAAWELSGRPLGELMHQPGFWLPFLLMVVWQVPHFLAIAWLYREDYAKAKLAMLPVIDPSGERTFRQILIGCLLLLPIGLLPTATGMSGKIAFVTALVCGLAFLALGVKLVAAPTARNARILFYASLVYLPLVLAAMMFKR